MCFAIIIIIIIIIININVSLCPVGVARVVPFDLSPLIVIVTAVVVNNRYRQENPCRPYTRIDTQLFSAGHIFQFVCLRKSSRYLNGNFDINMDL